MPDMLHEIRKTSRNWNSSSRCHLLVLLVALFAISGCGGQSNGDTGSVGTTGTGVTGDSVTEAPLEATDDPASSNGAGTSVREATATPLDAEEKLAPQGTVVTVQKATEGDTLRINPAIEGKNEVRLIGVDAPEAGTQPFGDAAVVQANSMIEGRKVALGFDAKKTDKSGRILAYVRLPGGNLFNEFMVLAGYAQVDVSPPNTRYAEELRAAQRQARSTKTGIWGLPPEQLCQLADDGNGIGGGC